MKFDFTPGPWKINKRFNQYNNEYPISIRTVNTGIDENPELLEEKNE